MIIGEALGRLFAGATVNLVVDGDPINDWPIKYHYGDQKELVKWIDDTKIKYPLVWYVTNPYVERNKVFYSDNTQLILLQQTKIDWFNTEKYVKTYTEVINPTWDVIRNIIEESPYVHALRNQGEPIGNKYRDILDEPSYGVPSSLSDRSDTVNRDFTEEEAYADQSIVQDFVDAKIINLNIRVQPECIT